LSLRTVERSSRRGTYTKSIRTTYHHTSITNAARKVGNPFLRAKPRTPIVLMLPELDSDTHESSGAAAVARAFARRYGRVALNDHASGKATYRS
jgi:hypothetical protein